MTHNLVISDNVMRIIPKVRNILFDLPPTHLPFSLQSDAICEPLRLITLCLCDFEVCDNIDNPADCVVQSVINLFYAKRVQPIAIDRLIVFTVI